MPPSLPAGIWNSLHAGRWLPPDPPAATAPSEPGSNLLPLIRSVWQQNAGYTANRTADRMTTWLAQKQAEGAELTCGVRGSGAVWFSGWLGTRLVWWPHGVPAGGSVGIVSSRLGRRLDERKTWFRALRVVCERLDPKHHVLLTATATAAAKIVEQAAGLFGLPLILVTVPEADIRPSDWLTRIRRTDRKDDREAVHPALLSPEMLAPADVTRRETEGGRFPLRDRAVVAISEQLSVLFVRRRGNLQGLIDRRLREPNIRPDSIDIALGPGLTPPDLAQEVTSRGAIGWDVPSSGLEAFPERDLSCGQASIPTASIPAEESWEFLTHWTRACPGPWPDETMEAYLKQLILDADRIDHSAGAALQRIITQQRVTATARTIRGGTPMVSFTAVPLVDVPSLRVFRPHRGRWDFEPYGVCIRRTWIQQRGGRPVEYGEEDDWSHLSPEDRPYFQLRHTRAQCDQDPIDWTIEREWRVKGDVDLRELSRDDGLLFVPSREEAAALAPICRWPVVVLKD